MNLALSNEDEELNEMVEDNSASFPTMDTFDEEDDDIGKEE